MADVKDRLREVIIKTLRLETVKPEDIQDDTPLFGEIGAGFHRRPGTRGGP